MWSYNNELYHHGIKGQKWGILRFQKRNGTTSGPGKKGKTDKKNNWSEDAKEYKKLGAKKISEMTNTELKKLNERQTLEKTYFRNNPSAIKKGMAVAGTIAGTMGTLAALHSNGSKLVELGKKSIPSIIESVDAFNAKKL